MRPLTLIIAGTLAACVLPSDTPPKVIYQSAETVGLEYADDGMMRVSNRQAVMKMIERHCGGQYRVVRDSGGRIDAECLR
jgi:hypothetical protein